MKGFVQRRRFLCVVGTRPEGVKMAPVIQALRKEPWADVVTLSTGQHRDMLNPILKFFGLSVDGDLDLMQPGQTLPDLSARSITALDAALARYAPDWVIAQGDTTSVAMTAMAAFYRTIPFAHVEAGLRTYDLRNPFPEEFNRVMATKLASLHFAPTEKAAEALRREGVAEDAIVLTGNTVIDALIDAVARRPALPFALPDGKRVVLVTLHRRESFGNAVQDVCDAVKQLTETIGDIHVVWPVHPNPNVQGPVRALFKTNPHVTLCDPLPYDAFVAVMSRATLILTDSGGVQEEAPSLAKPVLVLREVTERAEAVDCGVVELVGTDKDRIVSRATTLLTDAAAYRAMARGVSPYGDGHAAERIVSALKQRLDGDVAKPANGTA
ncbi:MAG TPA: UDP-N-acetylglucosamine 2-epimerase (non-hydrolyzing) [Rhizomicrobium sp.]